MSVATAIPILLGVSRSVDVTFDKLHAAHLLMIFDTQTCNAASTIQWWRQRPGTIAVTEAMPTKPIWGGFWHNDRHIDQSLMLFERPLDESENDRLVFVKGNETGVPERGTVWLTNTLAGGNHISVGDSLQIPVMQGIHEFKVAAIVVDANYSSGLISPTRAWVAPGELAMLFPMGQLHQAAVGVRFNHPQQSRSDWNDFVISRGGIYDGYTLDYEVFSTCYLVVFRLLGVILMLVAGVALVLVLGFIFATIQSAVLSDTRSIGVLQSIGMTITDIELMYVVQFALVALVAVPLGLLGSYFALKLVLSFMLQSLGTAGAEIDLWTPLLLTGLGVEIIIVSTAYFAARRCRQASPAEAIRYGVRVRARRSWLAERIWNLPRLPLVAGLALRSVLARKRKAVVPLLAIAFATTMATFSINTVQSINRIGQNLALWGWDNADVEIVRGGSRQSITHDEFLQRIGHDRRIAGIVPRSQLEAQIPRAKTWPRESFSDRSIRAIWNFWEWPTSKDAIHEPIPRLRLPLARNARPASPSAIRSNLMSRDTPCDSRWSASISRFRTSVKDFERRRPRSGVPIRSSSRRSMECTCTMRPRQTSSFVTWNVNSATRHAQNASQFRNCHRSRITCRWRCRWSRACSC